MAFLRALPRLALLVFLLTIGAASSASAVEPKIVAGTPANIEDHPYQVMVTTAGLGSCGGSIRDAGHVMTAAHCVVNADGFYPRIVEPGDVTVGYGSADSEALTEVGVAGISVFRSYAPDFGREDFDVAVLTLSSPITLGPTAAPIEIADTNEVTNPGIATGWGLNDEQGNGGEPERFLQKVALSFRPDSACEGAYGDSYNGEVMVCAGGEGAAESGNPDTCQGDSGGPLATDTDTTSDVDYELVGITSFGNGCGRPDTPGVYAWAQSGVLKPFLIRNPAIPAPSAPSQDPTINGIPQVGEILECVAPEGLDGSEPAAFLWYVTDGAENFTLVSVNDGTYELPAEAEGALIACDVRYENDGGFVYLEASSDSFVGPVEAADLGGGDGGGDDGGADDGGNAVPPDTTRPSARIGRVTCRARRCKVKVSAADVGGLVRGLSAKITYKVKRCRRGKCRKVTKTKHLRSRRSGNTFTLSFGLKPGRYKLVVAATDTAGNKSRAVTKSFRVKRR